MKNDFSTYKTLIDFGSICLEKHNIANYRKEAEWLLLHIINKSHSQLFSKLSSSPSLKEINDYLQCINLRSDHIPIQLIMGKATFYGRDFIIDPGVFIPRAETEIIINELKKKAFPH
tara:strand:+ start:439 stop:789 length:351 start_codon:yes stop_codon:yes gene_type:complete